MKPNPFKIESFLREHLAGKVKRTQSGWYEAESCPFCRGGSSRDKGTFAVHAVDGNYVCKRGKCEQAGSFWQLCEYFHADPRDYHDADAVPVKRYSPPPSPEPILPAAVTDYLRRRGFSDATIQACKIASDAEGNVVFPYYENDVLVMLKYRHPRKPLEGERKAWRSVDGKPVLWGLEMCDPSAGPLVIAFGEYDRMALYEAGAVNAVSVPSGDSDKAWIELCWPELERYGEIVLWPDKDESGERALHECALRLGTTRVRVVRSEYKDANEHLFRTSREATVKAAEKAIWYAGGELVRVCDIEDRPVMEDGALCGIPELDRALGGSRKGEITVHMGDNGAGKTSALLGFCAQSIRENIPVCVWSGEMDKYSFRNWSHLHIAGRQWLIEHTSQKSGKLYYEVDPRVLPAIKAWEGDRYHLYTRQNKVTSENLFETFELAYKRHECRTFVIDNLMKLLVRTPEVEKYSRQRDIIADAMDFAQTYGVHVHIVAHINKSGEQNVPPSKNNVSGTKEITDQANNVIAWWRVPKKLNEDPESKFYGADALACILKNRFSGDELAVRLVYDRMARRFAQLDRAEDLEREYGWESLVSVKPNRAVGIYSAVEEAEMLGAM
jgi:KaiC/GvpD/RAD55 family RecA-like ATPase